MDLRTFAWTAEAPNSVEHAVLTKADGQVPAYVATLEAAARDLGFSFAAYNTSVLPWEVLRFYDAVTGNSGTRCEHVTAVS